MTMRAASTTMSAMIAAQARTMIPAANCNVRQQSSHLRRSICKEVKCFEQKEIKPMNLCSQLEQAMQLANNGRGIKQPELAKLSGVPQGTMQPHIKWKVVATFRNSHKAFECT